MLIGAIVVHDQEFFVPVRELTKAICVEGDARKPAGEAADDFVGELVRELAGLRIVASHDRPCRRPLASRGCVIEEPPGDYDFARGFGEVPKGHQVGVKLRRGPIRIAELGGTVGAAVG